MTSIGFTRALWVVLAALTLFTPAARGHFLWVTVEPGPKPGSTTFRAFFNEPPDPDEGFTRYVRDVRLTVAGQTVPSELGKESRDGYWAGRRPTSIDSELDLGVTSREAKVFRLIYTARAQCAAVAEGSKESLGGLRVRVLGGNEKDRVEVLFDGKPVAGARLKVYPAQGDPFELKSDDQGRATVPGVSEGTAALWANQVDSKAGTHDGKAFSETRYYATLTYHPAPSGEGDAATAFSMMPDPAVTSLGAAVLDRWLYVYGGHLGKVHHYNVETTSRHFRRLSLDDRKTWEDLPMGPDLQGLALVTDGKALYRVGGMSAKNKPDDEQAMYSVADFAQFDPKTGRWTDLPPMPAPRSTHDAAVIGRTLYVVGGWTMKGATEDSTFLDQGLAIDLDHPSAGWKTLPQPFRRRALAAAAHAGRLYVLGGLAEGGMKVVRRVDVYDPASGAWSRGPDLPSGVRTEGFGSSAYELDGRLYVSGASGRIFRLDRAGKAWEAVGAWSHPRITHRVLAAPDHSLLTVGGSAGGKPTAVIERVSFHPTDGKASQPIATDE